jgi:hypothetical protein
MSLGLFNSIGSDIKSSAGWQIPECSRLLPVVSAFALADVVVAGRQYFRLAC